jgi:hypothetical protein
MPHSSCSFSVHCADLGVVGQAQVVVEAPHQHFLPAEGHVGTQLAFQLGKAEVTVALFGVATDGPRSLRILSKMSFIGTEDSMFAAFSARQR